MQIVSCPVCQKQVNWDQSSPYRPFCSVRCKQIDLGAWSDGAYRIAGTERDEFDGRNEEEIQ